LSPIKQKQESTTNRTCGHRAEHLQQGRHVFQQVCVFSAQEIVGKLHHFVLNKTTARMKRYTTHTHTHPFIGPLSGTMRVSWYQKGKTNLDFTEARDSEWQWHQLHLAPDR